MESLNGLPENLKDIIQKLVDEKVDEKMKEQNKVIEELKKQLADANKMSGRRTPARPLEPKPSVQEKDKDEDSATPASRGPRKVVGSKINSGVKRSESKE